MPTRTTLLGLLAILLPCGSAVVAGGGVFDDGFPKISWKQAADHLEQRCIVYGTIVRTKDISSRTFLNFDPDYRNTLTVMIAAEHYGNFQEPPVQAYLKKSIRVAGTIVKFQGNLQIVVESPDQIEIVDDPTPPVGSKESGTTGSASTSKAPGSVSGWRFPTTPPKAPADGIIRIATFNAYNLFDNFDDPYLGNEQLPGKPADQTRRLAETIIRIDADIVALQEIESRSVLEQFVSSHLADAGYREIVLIEGNKESDRGIDVALLSRFPVGPVTSYRHLDFAAPGGRPMRFQRDLLRARIEPPGLEAFDVLVVHLKSKRGGVEKTLPIRLAETTAIRDILDGLLRTDPKAMFVICGDFNDTADSPPTTHLVGQGPTALTTFYSDIPPDNRVTLRKYKNMVDFIFASPQMGKRYISGSCRVHAGTIEAFGSDHNPVTARFKLSVGTKRD